MKSRFSVIFLVAALSIAALSSCVKENVGTDVLKRDTDAITFDYSNSSTTFTVRVKGQWSATCDASWITLDPAEGNGDGVNAQVVTAKATHNAGEVRTATITVTTPSGQSVQITATQASGIFEIKAPYVSGAIKINAPSRASIDIPFNKAQGTEKIKVSATIDGEAAQGLTIETYDGVIGLEGNGVFSVPISGTATIKGETTIVATIQVGTAEAKTYKLYADVADEGTILMMTGSRFKWGGHYLEGLPGYRPKTYSSGDVYASDDDNPDRLMECAYGDAGSIDLYQTGAAYNQQALKDLRIARGIGDWTGRKVYEHPGYIKVGTGSNGGWLMTPPLSEIQGTQDITVSFEFFRWKNDKKGVEVTAEGAGEIFGGSLPEKDLEWTPMSLRVKGATNKTQIKWAATADEAGHRFTLRNLFITMAVEITEPLSVPENITCETTDVSANISWSPVLNATSYSVAVAVASSPLFKMTQKVEKTNCTFEGLTKNTDYILTVQAIYDDNQAMNSPVSDDIPFKTQNALEPLPAPTVQIFKSERALAVAQWTVNADIDAARNFNIALIGENGDTLRKYPAVSYTAQYRYNRFTFAKLDVSKKYTIAIQQVTSKPMEYKNSEWGEISFTSAAAPDMTNVVFYEDFNDMWMGGDYLNLSYAINPNTALKDYTEEGESFNSNYAIVNPSNNATDVGGPTTANHAYRYKYWPAWSAQWEEVESSGKALGYLTKIYPCSGCVKYGTGSANGVLCVPALSKLAAATNVTLSFDCAPYAIPDSSTGSLAIVATEGLNVTVYIVSGSGTIDGATSKVLTNTSPDANGSNEAGYFIATHHEVTITGADATTIIGIASGNQPKYVAAKNRIWLDNLKVTK
ncbi:MAG: fibronectin type III domain-containing protein [Bacteroidales bacterium]|nr:fibronectin type III domain-containing protein [Bacteroidales bacterium]